MLTRPTFLPLPVTVFLPLAASALAVDAAGAAELADSGTLGQIASHVPFWVWAVLLLIVYVGLKRTQPREVGFAGIVFVPGLLALYSLSSVPLLASGIETLAATTIGLVFGIGLGLAAERRHQPQALGYGRVRLEGDWSTLIIGLSVFSLRFATGVMMATAPDLWARGELRMAVFAVSITFVSLLVTRSLNRLRVALGAAATL